MALLNKLTSKSTDVVRTRKLHTKQLAGAGLVVIILSFNLFLTLSPPLDTGETVSTDEKKHDSSSSEFAAVNSATGILFSGKPFRTYKGKRHFTEGWEADKTRKAQNNNNKATTHEHCDNWAVVTTISGPTEAVKVAAQLPGWCIVVVADTKTPDNYVELANLSNNSASKMRFLAVNDQKKWAEESGSMATFVRSIPYKHFARKNIGYLYAIKHGAKFIFDFDDDNILYKDVMTGAPLDPIANKTHLENVQVPLLGKTAFNHHQLMKASIQGSWARGFPVDQLQDKETHGKEGFVRNAIPMENIAVMQYCANGDPDIDAVHRLVKPLPMNYAEDVPPLQVPTHAFAPYNAQASIHTYDALWATFLPYSVPGRVSDIWRGYFAEAIFRDLGLSVVFLAPKVRQDRNAHNYLADMQAELDLYFKAGKLIEFLSQEWNSAAHTIPERMEELWIELYQRGYIELDDVQAIQLWLEALVETGYQFPKVTRKRYDNIILMGQFNYANDLDTVVFWVQKWREVFGHVVVRGPFNATELDALQSRGINVSLTAENDKGFHSPMQNLMLELNKYKNSSGIDGVLYLHDDAFLDINLLTNGQYPFPTHNILGSKNSFFPLSYQDHRLLGDSFIKELAESSYKIYPNRTYSKADGTTFTFEDREKLVKSLKAWLFKKCSRSLTNAAADARIEPYKLPDGAFLVPSPSQADMLFVPTSLADEYAKAAQIMVDNRVHLECGFPTIVQMLQIITANITTETIELCTIWQRNRGKEAMINTCIEREKPNYYGMFHPYKLSKGLDSWGRLFDERTWASLQNNYISIVQ